MKHVKPVAALALCGLQVAQVQPPQSPAPVGQSSPKKQYKLSLRIAPVLTEKAFMTVFALTVTNLGDKNLSTYPPASGNSYLFVITPSGETVRLTANKFFLKPPFVIKPSTSRTWKVGAVGLNSLLDQTSKAPGYYRMYWEIEGQKSAEMPFLRE